MLIFVVTFWHVQKIWKYNVLGFSRFPDFKFGPPFDLLPCFGYFIYLSITRKNTKYVVSGITFYRDLNRFIITGVPGKYFVAITVQAINKFGRDCLLRIIGN